MGAGFGTDEYFITKDSKELPCNSRYALIILVASNSELYDASREVENRKMSHLAFNKEIMVEQNEKEIQF